MKIRRRYEKKMAAVRWQALGEGQEQGRTEILDIICNQLGCFRTQLAHNCFAHNAMLDAQAFAEGQRLLSYSYEESAVEEITAFSRRFYDSRKLDMGCVPPATSPDHVGGA